MSKWGKVFLIGTLLWQIPIIIWIIYYSSPNQSLILGLPSSVATFAALYLFYAIVFGCYITWKYVDDPTGKGLPIEEAGKEGERTW